MPIAAFNRNGDERNVNVNRNNNDWNDNWWFSGVRNSFHFSPVFTGEFCFTNCPFQPPSILPISSIFSDRAMYLLSSKDFVSHRTIKSIFKVSVFRIANLTHGCFSSRDKKTGNRNCLYNFNKNSINFLSQTMFVYFGQNLIKGNPN